MWAEQAPQPPHNCKTKVDVAKCHTCHTKRRWTLPSAAAPRAPSAPPDPAQCHKCHACHTKQRWMSPSSTPATQSAGAPRWPTGPSAISATPATQIECGCRQVPHLPRKTKVDVAKCHACNAKMELGYQARHRIQPAKCHNCHQAAAAPRATNRDQARHQIQPRAIRATPATQRARLPKLCVKYGMWQSCMWPYVTKLCATKWCVCVFVCVCVFFQHSFLCLLKKVCASQRSILLRFLGGSSLASLTTISLENLIAEASFAQHGRKYKRVATSHPSIALVAFSVISCKGCLIV